MKILAIDTSNHPLSIAVVEDEQLIAETTLNLTKNHSIYVMPIIEKLVATANWHPADLDRIVVAKGPGSYTGVRIAVTTAKTLAATLNIDLVGVSSLAVVAHHVARLQPERPVVAMFNARRGNVFAGGYVYHNQHLMPWLDQQHVLLGDLMNQISKRQTAVTLVGEITTEFKQVIDDLAVPDVTVVSNRYAIPSAYDLALLGLNAQSVEDVDAFAPDYLRITEAEVNWQKKHPGESRQSYVREV